MVIDASVVQISNDRERFSPQEAAGYMTIEEIDFAPTNEGEKATYGFRIKAPEVIASTSSILIWFPDEFDPSLNLRADGSIECWTSNTDHLGSLINCNVEEGRRVKLLGFNEINKDLTFDLHVSGVINPN